MITLEPQFEQQLSALASEEGISVAELIQNFYFEYQAEKEAIKRADKSYADYKKTGELVSLPLDPLDYSRPIHYSDVENTGERAFIDIEDAAQYGKQLRSSAWSRNNQHD